MEGYTPQTIVDQPIPLLSGGYTQSTGSNTDPTSNSDAEAPNTQLDQKFPEKIIAQETISQTINTQSGAIKGQYTFEELGAIKIGEYQNGVSGEIDISPDGITATNQNGEETFAIDGQTGNATFRGTVEAAGFTIADETGLHSLNNFLTGSAGPSGDVNTTATSYTDISGVTLTFTLTRQARVLILYSANLLIDAAGADGCAGNVCLNLNGTDETGSVLVGTGTPTSGGVVFISASASTIQTLAAGTHIIKLRMRTVVPAGSTTVKVSQAILNYITLGT